FSHVISAQRNGAAVGFQIGNTRAQATARGNGGVKGYRGARGSQQALLLRRHTAAVRGDQALREKVAARQVFSRPDAALFLHCSDFSPDLVEVDSGLDPEALLEVAQGTQEVR